MRPANRSVDHNGPRWPLYVTAFICFGPLAAMGLLQAPLIPFWIGMITTQLMHPERYPNDGWGEIANNLWTILLVVSQTVGVVVALCLPSAVGSAASATFRRLTLAAATICLLAFAAFDLMAIVPGLFTEPFSEWPLVGLAVYLVLPIVGTISLFAKTKNALFPIANPEEVA